MLQREIRDISPVDEYCGEVRVSRPVNAGTPSNPWRVAKLDYVLAPMDGGDARMTDYGVPIAGVNDE